MNNINNNVLLQLSKKLFLVNNRLNKSLQNNQKIIDQIKQKYEPRAEFNRWRSSEEGKLWKKQQYQKQKQCCAICQEKIELKGSHIDHIKPLSRYPDLSLDTSNLQIACGQCNISKSNSEILVDENAI